MSRLLTLHRTVGQLAHDNAPRKLDLPQVRRVQGFDPQPHLQDPAKAATLRIAGVAERIGSANTTAITVARSSPTASQPGPNLAEPQNSATCPRPVTLYKPLSGEQKFI